MNMNDMVLISTDDHVCEPPTMFDKQLSGDLLASAPKLRTDKNGKNFWEYQGHIRGLIGLNAVVGRPFEEYGMEPTAFNQLRDGCYNVHARIDDMDADGIAASMNFGSCFGFEAGVLHRAKDKQLGLVHLRAYNDWMIDEWCGAVPGRLIPLVIMPLWDAALAVAEVERCAAKGARAVTFSENPAALGLPSVHDRRRYWDPVFAVCADAGMPVCTHIGSSSRLPHTSDDAPPLVVATLPSNLAAAALADWLYSGLFVRHPGLRLCLSEGGIGWIPAILERADYVFERYAPRLKTGTGFGLTGMGSVDAGEFNLGSVDVRPSELFRDHVFGCFIDDRHGAGSIGELGVENVMVECDYPHGDSSWPHARDLILEQIAHLDPDEQEKVLAGNARRVFGLGASDG